MVAGAGFDGMTVSLLGPADLSIARALLPHLQRNGLTPVIVAFPQTIDGLSDALHRGARAWPTGAAAMAPATASSYASLARPNMR
jgi:hypothetical protein